MPDPLLSICVPTYNRAEFLDVCLATVVPQVAELAPRVECIVSDNASPDGTRDVVQKYEGADGFRYHCNDENLGSHRNFCAAVQRARGEFVWLIGDDDTLNKGGVAGVLNALEGQARELDLTVVNLVHAEGGLRPSSGAAYGGIEQVQGSVARTRADTGVHRFEDLLDGDRDSDFTAMYTVVVRRSLWLDFFGKQELGRQYTSLLNTYPHAVMLANTMPGKQAYYLEQPVLTLFDMARDSFEWARHYPHNLLIRAGELLRCFEENGVEYRRISPYYENQVRRARKLLASLMWDTDYKGNCLSFFRFLWLMKGYRWEVLETGRDACLSDESPACVRLSVKVTQQCQLVMWKAWKKIHRNLCHG